MLGCINFDNYKRIIAHPMFRAFMPLTETERLAKLCMFVRRPNITLAEQLTDLLPGHSVNQRWANYLLKSSLRSFSTLSEHYTFNGEVIPEALKNKLAIFKEDPESYHQFLLEMRDFFNLEIHMTNPTLNNYIIHHTNQDAILALARPIMEFIATKTEGEEQWVEQHSSCRIFSRFNNSHIQIHFTSYLQQRVFVARPRSNAMNNPEYRATFSANPHEELTLDSEILRQSHTIFTLLYELTTDGINVICQNPQYTIKGRNSARFNAIFQAYLHNADLPPHLPDEATIEANFYGPLLSLCPASPARPAATADPRFRPEFHHLMK